MFLSQNSALIYVVFQFCIYACYVLIKTSYLLTYLLKSNVTLPNSGARRLLSYIFFVWLSAIRNKFVTKFFSWNLVLSRARATHHPSLSADIFFSLVKLKIVSCPSLVSPATTAFYVVCMHGLFWLSLCAVKAQKSNTPYERWAIFFSRLCIFLSCAARSLCRMRSIFCDSGGLRDWLGWRRSQIFWGA